jgi:hypothetical protein
MTVLRNGVRAGIQGIDASRFEVVYPLPGFNLDGFVDGLVYSWVLEANIDSNGVAHDREGGYGVWNASQTSLYRTTVWSTLPGNAQLVPTGYTEVIITPLSAFGVPQGLVTGHGDSDYTILQTDGLVYTTAFMSAARTWTLPSAALYGAGRQITIADWFGWVTVIATLTIDGDGSETIDGALTYTLRHERSSVTLMSNGSSWKVIDESYCGHDILKTGNFSTSTSLDFVLSSYSVRGYKSFKFLFYNVTATGADPEILARVSTDGGSSFAATGYITNYRYYHETGAAAWGGNASNTTGAYVAFAHNQTENKLNFEFNLFYNDNLPGYPMFGTRWECYYGTKVYQGYGTSVYENSSDVDAIRFIATVAGTLAGSYTLIGVR